MKALVWQGKKDVRHETVPDPVIEHPRDAIIKVSTCAICGSDLHLFDGFMPGMKSGDVMGHEFMGEVVGAGRIWRANRQDSVRRRHEQELHLAHGPDAREAPAHRSRCRS